MANNTVISILYKANNSKVLLNTLIKLPPKERMTALSYERVKKTILSINDFSLLTPIFIDLPYDFRINFLKNVNRNNLSNEYEKDILDFLRLKDYKDCNLTGVESFKDIKNKQIITLIFRRLSSDMLKEIIMNNYSKTTNNYAFLEYSKKEPDFKLEAELINNVNNEILFLEMKRRKANQNNTSIDIEEFIKLDDEKQKGILLNGDLKQLESELFTAFKERNKKLNKEELCEYFKKSIKHCNYIRLLELQTIISIVDDETAEELIKIFFKEVLHFDFEVDKKYLDSMIYLFRKESDKTSELYDVTKSNQFAVINYLNTGNIDNSISNQLEKHITSYQYQKTNNKKINKIIKLFNSKFPNWKSTFFCYKMYYILGYDNTIELLNGKYGKIDDITLITLFFECDVKNVDFDDSNEPIVNKDFISFLIGDKKDENNNIRRILRGEIDLLLNEFHNLYNNIDFYQKKIGSKLHLNSVITLLKENPYSLAPHEYKLSKELIKNVISSAAQLDESKVDKAIKERYIKEACNFYHDNLENRVVSTIPRVIGKTEDLYSYEVLRLNDPLIMTLGYVTGCCFRLTGESKEFLKYCSESPYARVIVIRNQNNEICSMIPIIRNGNVIVGNSIESNSKGDNNKIYDALKAAFDHIISVSYENEEEPIIAGLVTNLHKNCYSNTPIGKNIFPIRDKDFYTNYNKKTFIVSKIKDKTEKDIKLYHPKTLYYDERPRIIVSSYSTKNLNDKDEAENRVKSIKYRLNEPEVEYEPYSYYTICNEDWYLKVCFNGVQGKYLDADPRAEEEFNIVKEYLEGKITRRNVSLDDSDIEEIEKPKKLEYKMQLKND